MFGVNGYNSDEDKLKKIKKSGDIQQNGQSESVQNNDTALFEKNSEPKTNSFMKQWNDLLWSTGEQDFDFSNYEKPKIKNEIPDSSNMTAPVQETNNLPKTNNNYRNNGQLNNSNQSSVAPANITGNESYEDLVSQRSDTLKEIQTAQEEKENNTAITAQQEVVEQAKQAYDEALENVEVQDEALQAEIEAIKSEKEANDSAITEKESEISGIKGDISSKEGEISAKEGEISSKRSSEPQQSSYTKTEYDENGEAKTVPDTEAYNEAHAQWEAELRQLEEAKEQLENELTTLQESLAAAEGELSELEATGSEIDSRLNEKIQEEAESGNESAQALQEALTAYQEAQAELDNLEQTETAQADANIAQLRANLEAYDNAINEKRAEELKGKKEDGTYETDEDKIAEIWQNKKFENYPEETISKIAQAYGEDFFNDAEKYLAEDEEKLEAIKKAEEKEEEKTEKKNKESIKDLVNTLTNVSNDIDEEVKADVKKLVIGFTTGILTEKIAEKAQELADNIKSAELQSAQVEKAQEAEETEAEETDEECLTDPIGITNKGIRYEFIVDDGDFDSSDDFLGANDGVSALFDLNNDDDSNSITGDELRAGNIMVVRTDPKTKQQTLISIDELEEELGGKISLDVSSLDKESEKDQKFDVKVTDENGNTKTYKEKGYSEYKNEGYFNKNYDYSIDNIKGDNNYGLASALINFPKNTDNVLVEMYGSIDAAVDKMQYYFDNDENLQTIFPDAKVINEGGVIYIQGQEDEKYRLDFLFKEAENFINPRNNVDWLQANSFDILYPRGIGEYLLQAIANSESNGQYSDDLEGALNSLTGDILIQEELKEGTALVNDIKNAQTREDVYGIVFAYCGGNTEAATAIYDYLMENSASIYNLSDKDVNMSANPYYGRDYTSLMDLLYENRGNEFVLNQNLLDKFQKTEEYGTDENGQPMYRPVKEYYTNFEGEVCTMEWNYHEAEDENDTNYVTLSFNEGDSTQELSFYSQKINGENWYIIRNGNGDEETQIIVETEDEFFKRLAVTRNYSLLDGLDNGQTENPSGLPTTNDITRRYAILKQYDENTGASLTQLMHQFSSEGWPDDIRNWVVRSLKTDGIDDQEIIAQASVEAGYSAITREIELENYEKAEELLEQELDRRLQTTDDIEKQFEYLTAFYGQDKALEILNNYLTSDDVKDCIKNYIFGYAFTDQTNMRFDLDENKKLCLYLSEGNSENTTGRKIKPDFFSSEINLDYVKSLEKNGIVSDLKPFGVDALNTADNIKKYREGAFRFLSNGGICNDKTISAYNTASNVFSQYNAAIGSSALLDKCETPEEAFKLITGKDIKSESITQEDIELFNKYYGFKTNRDGNSIPIYSYGSTDDYKDHYITIEARKNEDTGKYELIYNEWIEDENNYGKYCLISSSTEAPKVESLEEGQLFQEINDVYNYLSELPSIDSDTTYNISEQIQREKFKIFYTNNKDVVSGYIDDYAAWAFNEDESIKYYRSIGFKGSSAEELAAFIKEDEERLYNESCKYMQYGYTKAKQTLFGESILDNLTNQYCTEMATYASNLSHVMTVGCILASTFIPGGPALTSALMTCAKASGYLDNAIELLNMMTNGQNYQDDDYLGWATSTGFEWLTKKGYKFFSNIAGDLAGSLTEKVVDNETWLRLIDKSGIIGKFIGEHPLAQIIFRGSAEALIETGVSIPWTLAIKAIQGGDYNLVDELKENFFYDFLPYARGWQDMLSGEFKKPLYRGNNKYYQISNSTAVQVDPATGRTLGVYAMVGNKISEDPIIEYKPNDDGGYKVIEYNADRSVKTTKVISDDGNTVRVYNGEYNEDDSSQKPVQTTISTKNDDGTYTTRYYNSDSGQTPSRIVTTDANGRLISSVEGNTRTEYSRTGQRSKVTTTNASGEEVTVTYKNGWGKRTATVQVGDGKPVEYNIDKNGMYSYTTTDGRTFKFPENIITQAALLGIDVDTFAKQYGDDIYGKITQTDDVSCAVAAGLNATGDASGMAQTFANRFMLVGFDENGGRIYQATDGSSTRITVNGDSNLIVEAYKQYLSENGPDIMADGGAKVSDFFKWAFPNADIVKVQPNSSNISDLAKCAKSANSALVFSTTTDGIKGTAVVDGEEKEVTLSSSHGYTVEDIDENGRMVLSDPENPDVKIAVDAEEYIGKEGVQVVGATYDGYSDKLYDDNTEETTLRGSGKKKSTENEPTASVPNSSDYKNILGSLQEDGYRPNADGLKDALNDLGLEIDKDQAEKIAQIAKTKGFNYDDNIDDIISITNAVKLGITDATQYENYKTILSSNSSYKPEEVADAVKLGLTDATQYDSYKTILSSNSSYKPEEVSKAVINGITDAVEYDKYNTILSDLKKHMGRVSYNINSPKDVADAVKLGINNFEQYEKYIGILGKISQSDNMRPIYASIIAKVVLAENGSEEKLIIGAQSSVKEKGKSLDRAKEVQYIVLSILSGTREISDLSKEELLDIWSHRLYDRGWLGKDSTAQQGYITAFNDLCNANSIIVNDGEDFIRTVPYKPSRDKEFGIGNPAGKNGEPAWPAAAARGQMPQNGDLPQGVINRIINDKCWKMNVDPKEVNTIHGIPDKHKDSTVYVIGIPPGTVKGVDWSQTGNVAKNGFGSGVFQGEVDKNGVSTEVVFPGNAQFKRQKNIQERTIQVPLYENGPEITVHIVYIQPTN